MSKAYKSPEWKGILKTVDRDLVKKRVTFVNQEDGDTDCMRELVLPSPAQALRSPTNSTNLSSFRQTEMKEQRDFKSRNLLISFCLMLFVGLGNRIFQKLQTIPMYNYPNFLNLLTTFMYIPLSFAYIFPVRKYTNIIGDEQYYMPKLPFAIMGILDSLAGIMQVFASTYLDGSLLILFSQASIPISMIISKWLLKTRYTLSQYLGGLVVSLGILVVLGPTLNDSTQTDGKTEAIWSAVMILSMVPMTLSSVYKEVVLDDKELDPVFLNGWTAIFQFAFSLPLALPAALVGNPKVLPYDLPKNLLQGLLCFFGTNSIHAGPHQDKCRPFAPIFVTLYILFNVCYNILLILILKFGSANILFLSSTLMVPLGHAAFALPFMPEHNILQATDFMGLTVILSGLIVYRFGEHLCRKTQGTKFKGEAELIQPLLEVDGEGHIISRQKTPVISEFAHPLFTDSQKTALEFATCSKLPDTRQVSLDYL